MSSLGFFPLWVRPALLAAEGADTFQAWVSQPEVYYSLAFGGTMLGLIFILKLRALRAALKGAWKGGTIHPKRLESLMFGIPPFIIDLRPLEAYQGPGGHIRGSVPIPFEQLPKRLEEVDRDPKRPVVLVDDTDKLSHQVAPFMRSKGFKTVFVLQGGLKAWKNAGLPIYHHVGAERLQERP
jgi:rhodanese-related sulfurtransferase